ncbi:MAG: M20/M25/M40 family metallo-hydrolase [Cyclobacteriaceae bacterium]|nr:M20/M25/M40 family metallo-hydrolase [Cyclobacteriaceae bacterium]
MIQKFIRLFIVLIFLVPCMLGYSQSLNKKEIELAAKGQLPKAILELRQFLRLSNIGSKPEDVNQNLVWCLEAMKKRKFETTVLTVNDVPHVFAQRVYNKKLPTVLFYLQIDGQPVFVNEWDQPNPFEASLKVKTNDQWQPVDWKEIENPDSRIFARSVSDSKGPGMAFLSALDILDAKRIKPAFNVKIIMDFQEELGSPKLPELVSKNKDLLRAKLVLIMDGTRHISNLPTLNFGARGIATIKLNVFGASSELHSGQYGNYAPNPVFKLAKLLAGMKDDNGRVLIPDFYDGITLTGDERKLINAMPGSDADLNQRLGIAKPDGVGATYEESLQYPSLNVRGLKAASVEDEVRTIIPSVAIAELDLRLVPETDGARQVHLVKKYIEAQGYHFVNDVPTKEERAKFSNLISFEYRLGSKPFRTDLNSTEGKWLASAMDKTFGDGNYVKQRTTGGSQPIESFITTLNIPAVSLRIPNPDNNIHAANENLRVGNFVEGIQMCLGILTQPIK